MRLLRSYPIKRGNRKHRSLSELIHKNSGSGTRQKAAWSFSLPRSARRTDFTITTPSREACQKTWLGSAALTPSPSPSRTRISRRKAWRVCRLGGKSAVRRRLWRLQWRRRRRQVSRVSEERNLDLAHDFTAASHEARRREERERERP